eukprot:30773-Pelagococcus_subviridis.AAC.5
MTSVHRECIVCPPADGQDRAIFRDGQARPEKVPRPLAVNISANLRPTARVVLIYSCVTCLYSIVIIVLVRADCNDHAVAGQGHGPPGPSTGCLSVNGIAHRRPLA